MYLRFAIREIDEDSHRQLGVFHAARNLVESGNLLLSEEESLLEIRDGFNQHLDKPTRFTKSKPPFRGKPPRAIAWFKETAVLHIQKIREMARILESYRIAVDVFKAERVGYVVYEDEYQIVAEPLSDTVC